MHLLFFPPPQRLLEADAVAKRERDRADGLAVAQAEKEAELKRVAGKLEDARHAHQREMEEANQRLKDMKATKQEVDEKLEEMAKEKQVCLSTLIPLFPLSHSVWKKRHRLKRRDLRRCRKNSQTRISVSQRRSSRRKRRHRLFDHTLISSCSLLHPTVLSD